MNKLAFIKALWSPFKPFKLKWYCGKIALGTPYFFPRKWVKATPERAHQATLEYIKSTEEFNKRNPEYARKIVPYDEMFANKMQYSYAVPKKIGFDFVGLGWKTKWTDNDYRFEWAPRISFVFFGYQIAVIVNAPHANMYWESWLYYEKSTDKSKSKKERIEQCKLECSQTWTTYSKDTKQLVDYYKLILKNKYLWT